MSKVGTPDRDVYIQFRASQQSALVASRKRKLRDLYHHAPLPTTKPPAFTSFAPPPTLPGEEEFLEQFDLLKNKLFDETSIPDASRKAARLQLDEAKKHGARSTPPGSDASQKSIELVGARGRDLAGRPSSQGSQTDLPVDENSAIDVHDGKRNWTGAAPSGSSESDRVKAIESPSNSPGADPRQVMPISAEDAANLSEPLVEGLGSHDTHHKAATVHLPPQDVQERKLREARRTREQKEHLSINLPPRDGGRTAEPLSSPGSTIDAHSATTPALHDASTDTSPDNESSRYDTDRLDKEDDVETPIEFRKTPEEIAQKEEHDRILQAQMDISSAEILRSSPAGADDQLRRDQAASFAEESLRSNSQNYPDVVANQQDSDTLTKEAAALADDIEEPDGKAGGAETEDVIMSGNDAVVLKSDGKEPEIADSEAEDQSPATDAMDIDSRAKDSLDSDSNGDIREAIPHMEADAAATQSSATPPASTPRQTSSTPAGPSPAPERMTTRVQSGALRQKSVTEILGEIPRPNTTPISERSKGAIGHDTESRSPSRSSTPQSPGNRMRSLAEKAKERERSKLSTVIFPKARPTSSSNALVPSGTNARDTNGDYFMPLFLATASTEKRGVPSLDNLLQTAHKTITTSNAYIPINENQTAKVLRRIYNLQSSGKWSLRQPKRQNEPKRQETHWDVLLQEAKWMRTDFREERKWKMTVARNLAYACAEWFESGPEDRKLLQVNATPPKQAIQDARPPPEDVDMVDENGAPAHQTPDLVTSTSSGEMDSVDDFDEEPRFNLEETIAPAAIFTLQDDDVIFGLRKSPLTDKLMAELPMYGAPLSVPQVASADTMDPDRFWKKRALPLSKFVEGRMELKSDGPPRKKSRYEYEEEDDDDDDNIVFDQPRVKRPVLPPEQTDVALFNPEHKHTRDRIHAGHQFRPPSEYPMPMQSFFECRTASQWTWAEDDDLKSLVREHSYNWSLISSLLTSKSLFSSGAERRTPWECFERWISLEGLPADMQKTHYFRAYNSRLEAANRNVTAQAAQAAAQANGQGAAPPPRRRSTISFRVERRRQQKHLTLVDAMRKLAKKRETSIQKQQHAAGLAQMRRAQEVPQQRPTMHTPQDFSKLKFEREERLKEQMAIYQQRQEQQRRAAMQARAAGQNPQQALPNGVAPQQQRGPIPTNGTLPPNPNGTPIQTSQNLTVPGQNRARGPLPPQVAGQAQMSNGLRAPQPMMNGVPQAQMQGGQLPMPNPALDVGLVARAQNISEQQRQAIRMQQSSQLQMQGQNGQLHTSPPRIMSAMSPPNFNQMANGNMLAFNTNTTNGVSSPGPSTTNGQAVSPRMGQPQQLSGGMIPQVARIEETIRAKYPTATQDQVMRLIAEALNNKNVHQNQRQGLAQSAMNAAAGSNLNAMGNGQGLPSMNGGHGHSPQQYAQMLRQQQQDQQKAQAQASQAAAQVQIATAQNQQASSGHQRSGSAASGN